ncbi:protein ENHANCED DOWNY MILDEW 2-like [Bidens hawaiensis]|uniref:protein ENHANCED DOWNY MILDEW 2-like n=1 Tax=Bidens hawaiensis TaxID=980011 RepID=UPI00404B0C27
MTSDALPVLLSLCEGPCRRSFHPTLKAGAHANCESLGFPNEAITTYVCDNCKYQKHQCFGCGKLGSSDKSSSPEVFRCLHPTCGNFYHPECVANLICPYYEPYASQLKGQIAAGISFSCPIHKCHQCGQREDKDVHEMQFAVCRRCPKSYHRRCLPETIAFKNSDDGTILQRAWDDLLPKRILMYCGECYTVILHTSFSN